MSNCRKYVHEVLVNRLGDLSLPIKSVARLTDRPDMTSDVTVDVKQPNNNNNNRAAANAENVIRLGLGKVPQILTKLIYCWIGSYMERHSCLMLRNKYMICSNLLM